MVNNSTNINKTSSHLSPEIIEYKKKDREQDKSLPLGKRTLDKKPP
jgi:hypothetical protein